MTGSQEGRGVTMRSYRVPIVIEPCEEGGYYATCPSLPGCASQGETYLEALANIEEAVQGYVESLIAHGDPVPLTQLGERLSFEMPLAVAA